MIRPDQLFRAWGNIDDIFSGMPDGEWSMIGCISTEERCTGLARWFGAYGLIIDQLLIEVAHRPPPTEEHLVQQKIDANRAIFLQNGTSPNEIHHISIDAPFGEFERAIVNYLERSDVQNLVIDITSMPQKMLFFLTKLLRNGYRNIENIIMVYAEPDKYDRKALVANHEPWDALPGFRLQRDSTSDRKTVVAIGYDPMGLPEEVNSPEFNEGTTSFLFPFPAQPDRVARNWSFIRQIFPNVESQRLDIKRVDGMNVPEIFDELCGLGGFGDVALTLAPFGPKPVSLAMALYASKFSTGECGTAVFYTHPLYKNPNYSTGLKIVNGVPRINCYCLRLGLRDLY